VSLPQQRYVVAAAIVGIHALGIVLLAGMTVRFRGVSLPEPEPLYIRYFPSERREPAAPQALAEPGHAARAAAERPSAAAAPGPSAITIEPGPIDWDQEASLEADAIVRDLARREHRKCDDSDKPGSWLPKCKKHTPAFGWSDEHRAGFTPEGLPYVRLGKRCAVVMGFLGCALGALPEANGHLFDGLKDPDRDRSSVPDISAISEPVSQAPHRSPVFVDP